MGAVATNVVVYGCSSGAGQSQKTLRTTPDSTDVRGSTMKVEFLRLWIPLPVLMLMASCVSTEPRQLLPAFSLSPENVLLADNTGSATTPAVSFGLTGGINESDSLINVTVLPGVRVRAVSPGGPA